MFFVASDRPELQLAAFPPITEVPDGITRESVETARRSNIQVPREDGIVLTDDYNPLEYFDAANREALRHILAKSEDAFK